MKTVKPGIFVALMLAGLVAVVGLGIWTVQSLERQSSQLSGRVERVMALVRQERWDEAGHALNGLHREWNQTQNWWSIFIHHREIHSIDFAVVRIREYLWAEDEELALGEAAALKEMIGHIPEKECFNLVNIL